MIDVAHAYIYIPMYKLRMFWHLQTDNQMENMETSMSSILEQECS